LAGIAGVVWEGNQQLERGERFRVRMSSFSHISKKEYSYNSRNKNAFMPKDSLMKMKKNSTAYWLLSLTLFFSSVN